MKYMKTIISFAIFCGVILISCEQTTNNEKSIILAGRVTEADTSIYLGGVIVKDGDLIDSTDESGYFKLRGVKMEMHEVSLEKVGYLPTTFEIEYSGSLSHPLISKHIIMEKAEE